MDSNLSCASLTAVASPYPPPLLASTAAILPSSNDNPNLGVLNFLYDVSRPEDVTAVVTETAIVPVLSVPFVLREHKPINLGG